MQVKLYQTQEQYTIAFGMIQPASVFSSQPVSQYAQ